MTRNSIPGHDEQPLLLPTYQNRLRVIGRHLDSHEYHRIAVFEIEGGFIVRASRKAGRRPEALEFPDDDLPELMHQAIDQRGEGQRYETHANLLPTGYEDFFRALGYLLDNQMAYGVLICELGSHLLVTGTEPSNSSSGHGAYRQFERYLDHGDIRRLLDDAFERRSTSRQR